MAARQAPKRRAKSSVAITQPSTASAALPPVTIPPVTLPPTRLPRISKGKRPRFYDQVAIDELMAIVTALTAEISVAADRIDTLERVLAAAGVLEPACMESYRPNEEVAEARSAKREELLQRVFAVFEAYGT